MERFVQNIRKLSIYVVPTTTFQSKIENSKGEGGQRFSFINKDDIGDRLITIISEHPLNQNKPIDHTEII